MVIVNKHVTHRHINDRFEILEIWHDYHYYRCNIDKVGRLILREWFTDNNLMQVQRIPITEWML